MKKYHKTYFFQIRILIKLCLMITLFASLFQSTVNIIKKAERLDIMTSVRFSTDRVRCFRQVLSLIGMWQFAICSMSMLVQQIHSVKLHINDLSIKILSAILVNTVFSTCIGTWGPNSMYKHLLTLDTSTEYFGWHTSNKLLMNLDLVTSGYHKISTILII